MNPNIVIICYPPGSGGNFLARLLQIMSRNFDPTLSKTFYHHHDYISNENLTYPLPGGPVSRFYYLKDKIFEYCHNTNINLNQAKEYFRNNFV